MRIAGRNPGKLLFLGLYILINVNDAFELLAALLKDFFNLWRGPPLFLAFSQVLLDQTEMARGIGFDLVLFEQSLQDRDRPFFVFAKPPFSAGTPTDLAARDILPRPGLQEITNGFFVGVHRSQDKIANIDSRVEQKAASIGKFLNG